MRAPRNEYERQNWQGLVVGMVAVVLVGLAVYPPAVFGLALGGGLGMQMSGRTVTADARTSRGGVTMLAAGIALTLVLVVGELLGLGAERREFLDAWLGDGAFHLDAGALLRYPWAWLPQSAAIAALTSGAMTVARRR